MNPSKLHGMGLDYLVAIQYKDRSLRDYKLVECQYGVTRASSLFGISEAQGPSKIQKVFCIKSGRVSRFRPTCNSAHVYYEPIEHGIQHLAVANLPRVAVL